MKRYLTAIIMIVAGALSCTKEEPKAGKEVELPTQIVDNIKMEESTTGKKRYYLEGRRAFYYERNSRIVVLEPHIKFLGPDKEFTSEVVCDSGIVYNSTGDLRAYGHVVVTTQDSTVLKTDTLAWFNRRAQIETDAIVYITSREGTVQGKGLISDADLNKIVIKEKIEGTTGFSVEGEEGKVGEEGKEGGTP